MQAPRGTRLQLSISGVFALLILPALGAVIAFSYYENARNLTSVSKRFIDRARDDALDLVSEFLDPVGATLRIVSAVASTSPDVIAASRSAAERLLRRLCILLPFGSCPPQPGE